MIIKKNLIKIYYKNKIAIINKILNIILRSLFIILFILSNYNKITFLYQNSVKKKLLRFLFIRVFFVNKFYIEGVLIFSLEFYVLFLLILFKGFLKNQQK